LAQKEQLWRAVVDRWFGEMVELLAPAATLAEPGDPLEHLRELIVASLEITSRRPEMTRPINSESSLGVPRLTYLFEEFISPALWPFATLATKLQAEGKMRPVPVDTLFYLVTYGGTAPAANLPLAACLA
jgi:TetR/AcrR family transcriptional regulator